MRSAPSSRRHWLQVATLGALSAVWAGPAAAGSPINRATAEAAIEGHDPVSYHLDGQPQRGQARFNAEWRGARWWFASAAHRDQFLADPERFAPQFGGHCAYAMARDSFADGDPKRWRIVDGKLYLNANLLAQALWDTDVPSHITKAQSTWPRRRAELEARP